MKQIEPTLFADPQQEAPADHCPRCGGARYWPGLGCSRCERDRP